MTIHPNKPPEGDLKFLATISNLLNLIIAALKIVEEVSDIIIRVLFDENKSPNIAATTINIKGEEICMISKRNTKIVRLSVNPSRLY